MAPEDSPQGLPQGWSLKCVDLKSGRNVKYYINSTTGQKFYCKDDLIRYVKAQNPQPDEPQPTESPSERPSKNNQMHYTNDHPEWLPHGWFMELRAGKYGRVYKHYVDPSTGCKFYSKTEVFRHIENLKQKDSTSEQKEMPISCVPASELMQYTNDRPEWLPHGWIMELRTGKHGRVYKHYIDPSTGCKFYSKPEVFRHIETLKQKDSTCEQKEMPISCVPATEYTNDHPEWLPRGWMMELSTGKHGRVYKKYIDPSTGCKFYSKPEVFRHVETLKQKDSTSKQKEMPISCVPASKYTNDHPEWLPRGWIMELSTGKHGRVYKQYVDPSTGCKFYSKPEVFRHIETLKQKDSTSKQKKMPISCVPASEYTNDHPEWLPRGWIMELSTGKHGRVYKQYVDPSTGCKFYSKPEVFRHIETLKQKDSTSKQKEMPISCVPESEYTNDHPEWLPHGWIMELRARKCGRVYKQYVDPSTGCKFYSKPEVFRHIETLKQKDSTSKQKEMPISCVPATKILECTNDQAEWLPHGWNVELKTVKSGPRIGKIYKAANCYTYLESMLCSHDEFECYVDPSTGRKFSSKPGVFQYLRRVERKSSTSKQKDMVTTSNSTVEDLPPGWIKEIRIKKAAYGIRKDPLYIDSESGYVFFSKKDVQRYLETGDINSCAIIPKKRDILEKILPSSASKRQKLEHPVTKHQLIGGDRSSDVDSMASPGAYSLRNRTVTISALTNTTEISSQRSPMSDAAASKENPNENCSALSIVEDLERNEGKNLSAGGEPGHSFVEDDSRQVQNPDSRIKNEGMCQAQNGLSRFIHPKWLYLPRRHSKRLSGDEPDVAMNPLSILPLYSRSGIKAVGSGEMKIQNRLSKSKKAIMPIRFSNRLAGVESDQLANSLLIVQDLPQNVRPSYNEITLAADLNKGVSTQSETKRELILHSSSDADNPLLGSSSNESQGCDTTLPMLTIAEASEDLPILTPEAEMQQEKKCLESEKKQKRRVKNENNSRQSRKKEEFNLPRRSSKRLACIVPEEKPHSVSVPADLADEVVEKTPMSFSGIDVSCHEEADASCHEEANDGEGELPHGPPQTRERRRRFNVEQIKTLEQNFELGTHPEPATIIQLAGALGLQPRQVKVWFQNKRMKLKKEQQQKLHAEVEHGLETPSPLHGNLSNKNQPFVDAHADFKDRLQMLEFSKSHDKRPEPEFIPPLGEIFSDPCLEFAFKTLTGELPVEAASVNRPAFTPTADAIGERNFTTKRMGRKIKGKTPISSKKSKTSKKLGFPDEALEFQPEPGASPIITSCAFDHSARISYKTGAFQGTDLAPYSSAVEEAHQTCVNVPTVLQNESSINTRQYLDNQVTSGEHLKVVQISDKLEQRPFVSFDSWSAPCFGSPFKALASSAPVVDNITVKNFFQQQVEPSQIQGEGYFQQQSDTFQSPLDFSLALPDFGVPSVFQTDPPVPMSNHSFLFSGSLSFSSCSSIVSQPPPPPLVMNNQTPPHIKKNGGCLQR